MKRITNPNPGETKFRLAPSRSTASRIAEQKYSVVDLQLCNDSSGQHWAVKSFGGFSAMIGFLVNGGHLAILHKSGGERTLEIVYEVLTCPGAPGVQAFILGQHRVGHGCTTEQAIEDLVSYLAKP